MAIKSKTLKVLNYMKKYGSITSLKAFEKFRATRLSAIIYILREDYFIDNEWVKYIDEDGEPNRYVRYIFKGKKKPDEPDKHERMYERKVAREKEEEKQKRAEEKAAKKANVTKRSKAEKSSAAETDAPAAAPKRRGRPPKNANAVVAVPETPVSEPKRRGRPPKNKDATADSKETAKAMPTAEEKHARRGRKSRAISEEALVNAYSRLYTRPSTKKK